MTVTIAARCAAWSCRLAPALLLLPLAGCGEGGAPAGHNKTEAEPHVAAGEIALSDDQVAAAGITLVRPERGSGGGTIAAPALLEGDPQATQIVSAAIGGRVVSLARNLGDPVRRGETLAVIESREAAALNAEVERAAARAELARANLSRDEALFAKGHRPEREVQTSRAAAREAEVSLNMARQQVAASGLRRGGLNRIVIAAPIGGRVIGRTAMLGQTVAADAELFRVANLTRISVTLSLPPADASRVQPGMTLTLAAPGREGQARVRFVSPVLDSETRLVRVIADLDNRDGRWRVGEPVQVEIRTETGAGPADRLSVPADAVQTIGNRPTVFVRTPAGFRAVPVTLGRRDGPRVIIVSGLTGGERIAATNSFTLKAELGKGDADHGDH
ncbi:efflux RND transporter periplasmic adaptor subunit [Sphingomonas sp. HF-S3]|uniref:Efflux RND transporter periplasmic adaptor subunit n=1 Tax=Sphingomonas rustica TaxID=3103142 RepID=A0ABV0B289_9SPHN